MENINSNLNLLTYNKELECSICYKNNDINDTIIKCTTCNNINCIECFHKIKKFIKTSNNKLILTYKCPLCNLDNTIDMLDNKNYNKLELNKYIESYLLEVHKKLFEANITNNILLNKLKETTFYINNIYKIAKYIYIMDKIIFSGIFMYVLLKK